MSHPSKADLQEFLDRELPTPSQIQIEEHLAGCVLCRGKLNNAKALLENVKADLEKLDPKKAPLLQPLYYLSRANVPRSKLSMRSLILSPIRVPFGLIILLGLMTIVFASLFFSEKNRDGISEGLTGKSNESNFLTMTSSEGVMEKIALDIPWKRFSPAKNPIIFVMKENKP